VVTFYQAVEELDTLETQLAPAKKEYEYYKLLRAFTHKKLLNYLDLWQETLDEKDLTGKANVQRILNEVVVNAQRLDKTAASFTDKMRRYFNNEKLDQGFIRERFHASINYFTEQLHQDLLQPTIKHIAEYTIKKNTKALSIPSRR